MATQAARLKMPTPDQLAFHHDDTADSRSQRHHDNVRISLGCTSETLAQNSHACVVLKSQRQAEFVATPCAEINFLGIVVLSMGRQRSHRARINNARHSDSDSGEVLQAKAGLSYQGAEDLADLRQKSGQAPGTSSVKALVHENSRIFHHATTSVRAAKIDS